MSEKISLDSSVLISLVFPDPFLPDPYKVTFFYGLNDNFPGYFQELWFDHLSSCADLTSFDLITQYPDTFSHLQPHDKKMGGTAGFATMPPFIRTMFNLYFSTVATAVLSAGNACFP